MIKNLIKFVNGLPQQLLKKDDMVDEIDDIYSNIRLNIKPMTELVIGLAKKHKSIRLAEIPFLAKTNIDVEYKDTLKLVIKINSVIDGILSGRDDLEGYIAEMPKQISTNGITTNQALSLNVLDNLRFFIELTGDILIAIVEHYNNVKEPVFTEKIARAKKNLLYDYYNIITDYASFKSVLVDLDNMVITNNNTAIVENVLSDRQVNVVSRGFVGNPIYHFRIWLVNRDIAKIKVLEKKKEYVELLLAELELKQSNQYDASLDESIENAKALINEYEDKIEKLSK